MQENKEVLHAEIQARKNLVKEKLGIEMDALILPIVIADNKKVMEIKAKLERDGYAIGAIREPTVPKAIIRIITRLGESRDSLATLCDKVTSFR
jgi:8-amino-7-oxononanoate synthase